MSELIIYHNNRCSKSRQTLQLLEQHNKKPTIVEYLKNPPSFAELQKIILMLGFTSARQLMRSGEEIYKSAQLASPELSETQLIEAMLTHPNLIERPIVIYQGKAALGRPPENVLSLL
ncbi:arsenate reductase (glutaredoxin) [Paraglaciecola hydrolytica]|uniref:Arsenate reductase n=1 Tax=Paraglaciecola hydrolytica TaxID=1799789 RepID=A0A136A189_9ALTE|nr:arsenate reductase (glutaredoxin) [Paraglaciecola hydrolytica]KXI28920.1 arsenate reductase [Paraglaciecola hydrolytica]